MHFIDFNFLTDYSADKTEVSARVLCIGKDHPTLQFAFDEVKTVRGPVIGCRYQ